jgi:hypothetical protein
MNFNFLSAVIKFVDKPRDYVGLERFKNINFRINPKTLGTSSLESGDVFL